MSKTKNNMKTNILKTRKGIKKALTGTCLTTIGFILSPLTWWNDLFVNLPLAFAFAYIVGLALSPFVVVNMMTFFVLMAIGYFLTNVLGFMLMHKGTAHIATIKSQKKAEFCWKKNLAYSLIAVVLVGLSAHFGLLDLSETEKLTASVLKVHYLAH